MAINNSEFKRLHDDDIPILRNQSLTGKDQTQKDQDDRQIMMDTLEDMEASYLQDNFQLVQAPQQVIEDENVSKETTSDDLFGKREDVANVESVSKEISSKPKTKVCEVFDRKK